MARKSRQISVDHTFQAKPYPELPGFLWLNSNQQGKNIVAVGRKNEYQASFGPSVLSLLEHATQNNHDWLFGYLSYDLKNYFEELESKNTDSLEFPLFHFWQPIFVVEYSNSTLDIHYLEEFEEHIEAYIKHCTTVEEQKNNHPISLKFKGSKTDYLDKASQILDHIHRGEVYEMNFCQEFAAEGVELDPWAIYNKMNKATLAPYSIYLEDRHWYCMGASPELFLKKTGLSLLSSPIKGTAPRNPDSVKDEELKIQLARSKKEQAENIMIVDLVRNDLSKICKAGSVKVEPLLEIKSLKTVHQLVSTVRGELTENRSLIEILAASFPMGSMTGAPKIAAMQLAEKYESTKRGLYSGSVGYIEPNGDFQFNVVIRSLCYNSKNKYLSLMTGSALTALSDPEKEYEEVLLKAKAIVDILAL